MSKDEAALVSPARTRSGVRATNSAKRRAAILDAALDCFARKGLAATTIEDLRVRSGASIGSIYHHFGPKEEVAASLYIEALRAYQEGLLSALSAQDDAQAGIEAGVRHHIDWVTTHPAHARFLLGGVDASAARTARSELRELNRRFFADVMSWLRPHQDAGMLRIAAPDVLYALWIGPSQELTRHWLEGRLSLSLADATPTLARAAWQALRKE